MLSTAGGHCVAQHPPRQGSDPVGRFVPAARLNAPQGRKQLLGGDLRDRPAAKVRVEGALQPRAQNGYGLRGERLALQLEPFLRHALEGLEKRCALRLTLCAWIDVIRDQSARLVALLACALQRHVRISAQRDKLLASSHAIAETLQSAAGGATSRYKPRSSKSL